MPEEDQMNGHLSDDDDVSDTEWETDLDIEGDG